MPGWSFDSAHSQEVAARWAEIQAARASSQTAKVVIEEAPAEDDSTVPGVVDVAFQVPEDLELGPWPRASRRPMLGGHGLSKQSANRSHTLLSRNPGSGLALDSRFAHVPRALKDLETCGAANFGTSVGRGPPASPCPRPLGLTGKSLDELSGQSIQGGTQARPAWSGRTWVRAEGGDNLRFTMAARHGGRTALPRGVRNCSLLPPVWNTRSLLKCSVEGGRETVMKFLSGRPSA